MENILEVKNLKKYFDTNRGSLHAVDDISFSIGKGQTLGVVGESGCGKSTLGRVVLGLIDATDGHVFFDGRDITHVSARERMKLRRDMQIVFQDPFSSLNPRMCVSDLIADPLKAYGLYRNQKARQDRVFELMETVGLDERMAYLYPHELDGGRRQRIGIARALALEPKFVVCDEPVSALDVSIQAQVLNLLQDLQEAKGLTYMFITHDLSVVKHISDDIMVMYVGTMVEKAASEELFEHQLHPYTKGLLSAIPIPSINVKRERVIMKGEIVSPINPKPGCRFAARCDFVCERCHRETPELEEVLPGHFAACHRVREINDL